MITVVYKIMLDIISKNSNFRNRKFAKISPRVFFCADRLPSDLIYRYLLYLMLKSFSMNILCDFKRHTF